MNSEPRLITAIKTDRQMSTVRFSPCGRFLAAAGRDGAIRLWVSPEPAPPTETTSEQGDGKGVRGNPPPNAAPIELPEVARLNGHNGWVTGLEFHPKEPRFYSIDSWGKLSAWSYVDKTPQPLWTIDQAHDGWIRQFGINSDGTLLVTCGMDKAIHIWSTDVGKKTRSFAGLCDEPYAVAFHPNGESFVSGDLKGVIKEWNLSTGEAIRELDAKLLYMLSMIQDVGGVRSLAFDHDGLILAAAGIQPAGGGFVQGSPLVRLFDWKTGKETQTLKLGDNTEGFVHELKYHPQGFFAGVISGQPGKGKFFFLKPTDAQPFFVGDKQMANCHTMDISQDGSRLAVASNAGTFGQQKSKAREGIYPGNTSVINVFEWPRG